MSIRFYQEHDGTTHTLTYTDISGMPVAELTCQDGHWFTQCACQTDTEGCVSP